MARASDQPDSTQAPRRRRRWRWRTWLLISLAMLFAMVWAVWQFGYDGADPRMVVWPKSQTSRSPAALDEVTSLHVDNRPLRDVLADIAGRHDVSIRIDDAAWKAAGIPLNPAITLHLDGVTVRSVLDLLARQADDDELTVVERDGGLLITTHAQWQSNPASFATRIHQLDGLMKAGGRFDEHIAAELVSAAAPHGTWIDGGGLGEIHVHPGALVVRQTPRVQREIASLLAALEQIERSPDRIEPLDVGLPASAQSGRERILQALDRAADIDFDNTSLDQVCAELSAGYEIPIATDVSGTRDRVSCRITGVSLRSALRIMLRDLDLIPEGHNDVLVISSPNRPNRPVRTRLYPVADLVEDSGPRAGDNLVDAVYHSIQRNHWRGFGGPGDAACEHGVLLVRHFAPVHEQVERLLAHLRHVRFPSRYPPPQRPADVAERKIETVLAGPTTLEFRDASLEEVARAISREHGVPVHVDTKTLAGVGVTPETRVEFLGQGIRLEHSLRWMLETLDLTFMVRDEALIITTPEEAEEDENLVPRVYLIPGPYRLTVDESYLDYDEVMNVVTTVVSPDAWDFSGPYPFGTIRGMVVYPQTREVHHEIAAVHAGLEQALGQHDVTERIDLPVGAFDVRPALRALERQLSVEFSDAPLAEVAEQLQQQSGQFFRLDKRALDSIGVGGDLRVTFRTEDASLRSILNDMLPARGLAWQLRDGAVSITSPDEAEYPRRVCIYPIRDLLDYGEPPKASRARQEFLVSVVEYYLETDVECFDVYGDEALVLRAWDATHEQVTTLLAKLRELRAEHADWKAHVNEAINETRRPSPIQP